MDIINLNKSDYMNLPTLNIEHYESNLYIKDNNTLYKILFPYYRLLREKNIYKLCSINNRNCVLPKSILYNNNDFIGYSMDYLYDYKILSNLIFSNISYEERLLIANKLCKIIENFSSDNFVFTDLYPDNIMIKNHDLKIIDMDSVIFKDDYNIKDYNYELIKSHQLASYLVLSLLSKINIFELINIVDNNILIEAFSNSFCGKELSQYLDNIFNYPNEIVYPSSFINNITEDDLIKSKNVLRKKLI